MRLLDRDLDLDSHEGIELTPVRVVGTPDMTHIRYPRIRHIRPKTSV
jgi:hypothetical protein